jgi:TPR repeat protein
MADAPPPAAAERARDDEAAAAGALAPAGALAAVASVAADGAAPAFAAGAASAPAAADDASSPPFAFAPTMHPAAVGKTCALCGADFSGGKRLMRCGGCRAAHYCSREHQAAHWNAHARDCAAEVSRREAQEQSGGLVLSAEAASARAEERAAAAAAAEAAADRARIETLGVAALRLEIDRRGALARLPAGASREALIAARLAAPAPTAATLAAAAEREERASLLRRCRLCEVLMPEEPAGAGSCEACRRVRYCGAACRRVDLPRHKAECRAWADASVVAAGGCPLGNEQAARDKSAEAARAERLAVLAAAAAAAEATRLSNEAAARDRVAAAAAAKATRLSNEAAAREVHRRTKREAATCTKREAAKRRAAERDAPLAAARARVLAGEERRNAAAAGGADAAAAPAAQSSGAVAAAAAPQPPWWKRRGVLLLVETVVLLSALLAAAVVLVAIIMWKVPTGTLAMAFKRGSLEAQLARRRCPLGDIKAQQAAIDKWKAIGKRELSAEVNGAKVFTAAEGGDPAAQYVFALVFNYDFDVGGFTQDGKEFVKWLQRASAGNLAAAQTSLGLMHMLGRGGLAVDHVAGARLYAAAAAQGHANAQAKLAAAFLHGEGVPVSVAAFARLILMSAEQGYAPAQSLVAGNHLLGTNSFNRSFSAALLWARRAADQKNEYGEYLLGSIYREGLGVPVDLRAAVSLFARSAAQGDEDAKTLLRKLALEGAREAAASLRRLGEPEASSGSTSPRVEFDRDE